MAGGCGTTNIRSADHEVRVSLQTDKEDGLGDCANPEGEG